MYENETHESDETSKHLWGGKGYLHLCTNLLDISGPTNVLCTLHQAPMKMLTNRAWTPRFRRCASCTGAVLLTIIVPRCET